MKYFIPMFSDFESMNHFDGISSSDSNPKVNRPFTSFAMKNHPDLKDFYLQTFKSQNAKKNVRRRRRRQNNGILRLAVTDNINVLRARLLSELRRRQQQARQNAQNHLNTIG